MGMLSAGLLFLWLDIIFGIFFGFTFLSLIGLPLIIDIPLSMILIAFGAYSVVTGGSIPAFHYSLTIERLTAESSIDTSPF